MIRNVMRIGPRLSHAMDNKAEAMVAYLEYLGATVPHPPKRDMICPFHDDTRPSAGVTPDRKGFNCFNCEAKGDVVDLVIYQEGVDFNGAFRFIEEKLGYIIGRASADQPGRGVSGKQGAGKSGKKYVPPGGSSSWGQC
jgi:hypothetical protein